jgi:hypothetical protein
VPEGETTSKERSPAPTWDTAPMTAALPPVVVLGWQPALTDFASYRTDVP